MKETDSNKLRVATTGQRNKVEALFSSEFTFFAKCVTKCITKCITKACIMHHGNKTQAFEIYGFNFEPTTPNIKYSAAAVDLTSVICVKAAVTRRQSESFCLK